MAYVNNYAPPQVDTSPVVLPDPNQPYDLNFCFPVRTLETDRVKLVPFLPHVHAKAVYDAITKYPQVMHFMPWPDFATQRAFEEHVEMKGRREPSFCLFVTLNKEGLTEEDEEDPDKISNFLLGTIAYCNASRPLATVEIGFIIVLPPYQRTHVSSHAIGLMMQYALDLPKDGGLGVRRCQWQAHASNQASVRAGMRLGFKMEGIIRWQRPLPEGKESGAPFRTDDSLGLPGRHSAVLAVCWDDWEDGGRELVKRFIERK
ncbi:hypothetical protein FRC08_015115 [Ceratobasidium sp. 394]|nr:hypothetical protein FRC08_015115 [Ceratobasidium sp. 394]KAG9089959.1 hypothetical protein FS749_000923 [Ceratobasidium sp. UAMH 11750]